MHMISIDNSKDAIMLNKLLRFFEIRGSQFDGGATI